MACILDKTVNGTLASQMCHLQTNGEANSQNTSDGQGDTTGQSEQDGEIEQPTTHGYHEENGRSTGNGHTGINSPKRSFMDNPDIKWRLGHPPDYSLSDKKFMEERSKHHKSGSLEETVENLVKTWEMEASHKLDPRQWESVHYDSYRVVVNGIHSFNIQEALERGTYNMLIADSPYYDTKNHTFQSSHHLFREAFQGAFPWELLEVLSGPPKVTFTWRHWGLWSGNYDQTPPTNETVEAFGICIAHVNEDLKIIKLEVFFDANHFLRPFMEHSTGKCPVMHGSN